MRVATPHALSSAIDWRSQGQGSDARLLQRGAVPGARRVEIMIGVLPDDISLSFSLSTHGAGMLSAGLYGPVILLLSGCAVQQCSSKREARTRVFPPRLGADSAPLIGV